VIDLTGFVQPNPPSPEQERDCAPDLWRAMERIGKDQLARRDAGLPLSSQSTSGES
jgi:hypothetical protein